MSSTLRSSLVLVLLTSIYLCIHGSWISSIVSPSSVEIAQRRRLDAMLPLVEFEDRITGVQSTLTMIVSFENDAPVNSTLSWHLPHSFDYIEWESIIPTIEIDNQSTPASTILDARNRSIQYILENNSPILAGRVFHFHLATRVPPSSGNTETFHVRLLSDGNDLIEDKSATTDDATQPANLNVAYAGMRSHQAEQETGLIVAFTTTAPIPPNGLIVFQFHPQLNITAPVEAHMLTASGNYTIVQSSLNVIKVQRSSNSFLPAGSTVALWLSNIFNPSSDSSFSPGRLLTLASEDHTLEQNVMSNVTIFGGVPKCLGQCAAGFFVSSFTSSGDLCAPCPLGSFCAGGCAPPTPCPIGTASNTSHAVSISTCLACPGGTTALFSGSTSCEVCPIGMYCPNSKSQPLTCPQSTFSPAGSVSCTACPAGYDCPAPTINPIPCVLGSYSITGGGACRLCPPGSACINTTALPQLCPSGTYSLGNTTICSPCIAGQACALTTTAPAQCANGTYALALSSICTVCPAGSYCPSTTSLPLACPLGSYSLAGSMLCSICPAGKSCPTTTNFPVPCPAGSYSAEGNSTCTHCPAGYSCIGNVLTPCSSGEYSLSSDMHCTICPAGSSCLTTYQPPSVCPSGAISTIGQVNCSQCQPGYFCPSPSLPQLPCGIGYYSVVGSITCTICPAGSSCDTTYMLPIPCPIGTTSSSGSTVCSVCPPGMKCPATSAPPTACTSGSYSPGGQTSCSLCPAGFACFSTTISTPISCTPGSFALSGSTNCTTCAVGKYCPFIDQALQLPCPPGTFSTGAAANCTQCPSGYSCSLPDGSANMACASGYFSIGGTATCTKCPPGYACPSPNYDSQIPCTPGTYSTGGLAACLPCPAGFECPDPNTATKVACTLGTYADIGQSSCTQCPGGYSCLSTSTSNITRCILGRFSKLGQPDCTICPAGSYCDDLSAEPTLCDPGYYSLSGQDSCTACPAGYECPQSSQPPQPCPIGYWSPGSVVNCLQCTPGYRCSLASTSPTPPEDACPAGGFCNPPTTFFMCPAGTYGNSTAGQSVSQACSPCPEGYYCPSGSTAVSMQPCQPGFYCPLGTAISSTFPCPAGQYNPNSLSKSSAVCLNCPAGSFCPLGSANPIICPSGSFCPANTQSSTQYLCPAGTYGGGNTGFLTADECISCTLGNYCPEGSVSPIPCPAGHYNPFASASGIQECIPCPAGWSCPHVGQVEYKELCSPGHFCPVGTVSALQNECPPGTFTDSNTLTRVDDCTICPERFACLSGSGANALQKLSCAAGYFCPNGTAFPKQFPCYPGTWSASTNLARASECSICPSGSYCAGGGSSVDGSCAPGHFCPEGTPAKDRYPCPAGTYTAETNLSDSTQCTSCPTGSYCPIGSITPVQCPAGSYTSLQSTAHAGPGSWPQCTFCPSGSYCPIGSVTPLPCGTGYHSPQGSASCRTCSSGYFCGSNTTPTELLSQSAGLWTSRGSLFGRCYNGTFCPGGMNYEPTLELNACPQGFYCPMAVSAPIYCPAGTYNNVTGQDELGDCVPTPSGYFSLQASIVPTGQCSPGYYCPSMSTSRTQVACPPRYFLDRSQGRSQDDCIVCPAGKYCSIASIAPIECPQGYYCITGTSNPEPCPLGTFGNATNLKMMEDCTTCLPGMYCDGTALTNPSGPCDAGFYCSGGSYTSAPSGSAGTAVYSSGGLIGGLCTTGGYCPLGSYTPIPCPAGTFNNATGAQSASDCSPCPPGSYCQSSGLALPTGSCAAGYYCVVSATTPTQYESPVGYYSTLGSYGPSACSPGAYNNQVRQAQCTSCPARFYCNGTATVTPSACPTGYYCPQNTALPAKCPAGTYSNGTGLAATSECLLCPPGFYCASSGLTEPSGPCMAGYVCTGGAPFQNPNNQTFGTICPPGSYCPQGSAIPILCPLGTYRPNTLGQELSDCTPSPGGTFCNGTGLVSLSGLCAAGYYCSSKSSTSTPTDGITGDICPLGYFCPLGSNQPRKCIEGTYSASLGLSTCTFCPAGSYCDGVQTDKRLDCPQGYFCPPNTNANPYPCPMGTFSNTTGLINSTQCTLCTGGSYCSSTGLVQPTGLCLPGYYCLSGSASSYGQVITLTTNGSNPLGSPANCTAGNYCPLGTFAPLPCPQGTYRPAVGGKTLDDCLPCPAGYYCGTVGSTSPTGQCSSGYYCHQGSSVSQPSNVVTSSGGVLYGGDICPTAHYCPIGSTTPIPCEQGTYATTQGMSSCSACPPGYYCPTGIDVYSSYICPPGYYCLAGTTRWNQYPCPTGTYSNQTGLTNVTQCILSPGGMYVNIIAATSPVGNCSSGYFCTGGATNATPSNGPHGGLCPLGASCPAGSSQPIMCKPGYYCPDISTTLPCRAGFYCIQGSYTDTPTGQMNAFGVIGNECPQGSYCPQGSSNPSPCPAGSYGKVKQLATALGCTLCDPGYICPTTGLTNTTILCPAGSYCPGGQLSGSEYYCPLGSACPTGSISPHLCPPGTYTNETGMPTCQLCPAGFFCVAGTITPQSCPQGFYCPTGTQSGTKYPCLPGTYGASIELENSTNCLDCPPGKYCSGTNDTSAPTGDCDASYYCSIRATTPHPSDNHTTGGLCAPGYVCLRGASVPTPNDFVTGYPCPPGSFCVRGSSYSVGCAPGYYTPFPGAAICLDCPIGAYCPQNTSVPIPCSVGSFCPIRSNLPLGCPPGTFSNITMLVNSSQCAACTPGYYCNSTGLDQPTGMCTTGYVCVGGSPVANPVSQIFGSLCPPGSYCPTGSSTGIHCPVGTYRPNMQGQAMSDCSACPGGTFCNGTGLVALTGLCSAGHYCTSGASTPTPVDGVTGNVCPIGHYCPLGAIQPLRCLEGTYADSIGQPSCNLCPAGSYCDGVTTDRHLTCPTGYYCPQGTRSNPLPCPIGTFSSTIALMNISQCTPCTPGSYCNSIGLTAPTGLCFPGYICQAASVNPYGQISDLAPVNATLSANVQECISGNYCPEGTYQPQPCPIGTYLPSTRGQNVVDCLFCPPGNFCNVTGSHSPSGLCEPGYYCALKNSMSRPLGLQTLYNGTTIGGAICPIAHFCPRGSMKPIICPEGTYGPTEGLSICITCPTGYYCPAGIDSYGNYTCRPGYYCPVGTPRLDAFPCPRGSYSSQFGLQNQTDCTLSPGGMYVDTIAATAPTGNCSTGYYCLKGAISATPDESTELYAGQCPFGTFCPEATSLPTPCDAGKYCSSSNLQAASPCAAGFYCIQGSYTATPTGQLNANGVIGNECPAGSYCPHGTSNPIPCPSGTYSNTKQLGNVSQCLPCAAGYICPDTGTTFPRVLCPATKYCPGGSMQIDCTIGHYCPPGSSLPVPCPAGSFSNLTGLANCLPCPMRYYCDIGTVSPLKCPRGHYCPLNTSVSNQYPCRPGSYSNETSLGMASECRACRPGYFCDGQAPTDIPTGPCSHGYFCSSGAKISTPNDHFRTGGVCDNGHVCLGGASIPNPVDGITGRLCAPGSFCVNGTEQQCPIHTYTSIFGQSTCAPCPLGRYCPGNTSVPVPCPLRYYCPIGPALLCPNGTYGAQMGLESPSQCSPCPAGRYCSNGNITGLCISGYFCKFGNPIPNPLTYNQTLLAWQQTSGGPCPNGYYCPEGTSDPQPCPTNSSRMVSFGTERYDCSACPAGKSCLDGITTVDCPAGHYCPYASVPIPCPEGTFNQFVGASTFEACVSCSAGRWCNRTGIVNDRGFDCPPGHYCTRGTPDAIPCPAGTFLPTPGGAKVTECLVCPGGYSCSLASLVPRVCESGTFCAAGSGAPTVCPSGYFCPFNSTKGQPCLPGYYCPVGSSIPIQCGYGTYCPPFSSSPIPCPLGSLSILKPTGGNYSSLRDSCKLCPPGYYGDGAICTICPAGYVCLEGAVSPTPQNATFDRGYPCPEGHYCGNGTFAEAPCPVGTFNPSKKGESLQSCLPCPVNTYQYSIGQATCFPCSKSATAPTGSTQCNCVGNHRAFQLSDGFCICEPGYEYYDLNGILRSDQDDTVDCQPMVYTRCSSSQVRTLTGSCQSLSTVSCNASCNGGTGEFLPTSGLCQCSNVPDLDTICDANCRASTRKLQFNAATNQLESYDPLTDTSTPVSSSDQNSIYGTLTCVSNSTSNCNVVSVSTTGNSFAGTYDTTLTTTSNRRRLAGTSGGIMNPMICLQKGDSIMFGVSNESYPIYAKDSLMNTNPGFDYGSFRTLEEKMKSNSLSINAFAFSFVQSGIYIFALSNNKDAITIVTVMETGVKCPTDGPIVPLNQANLIKLNAKPSSNIILAPDWGLIAGLLAALFGVVAGLIFGLYYFRRKSWVAKQIGGNGYKDKARGFNMTNLTTKGSVVKKNAKPLDEETVALEDLENKLAKPNDAKGEYQPELNRWDDDDLGVRDLVDRLQYHHDSVEKAFQEQEAGAVKMMKMLQNEADELKRLLASIVVAHSNEKEPEGYDAEMVLVESLEKTAAARAEFEAQLMTAEDALLTSAKTLADTVQDKGIISTIIDEMIATDGNSPHFEAITRELSTLSSCISSTSDPNLGVWPILQSEQNRRKVDAAVWQAFGKSRHELLPLEVLELRQKCAKHETECDEKAREVCEGLLKFSNAAPAYLKKLEAFKETCALEIKEAKEQQNPALLKPLKQKHEKLLQGLLKELQSGSTKLAAKVEADKRSLQSIRLQITPVTQTMKQDLNTLRDEISLHKSPSTTNEVAELITQLRALLANNPMQLQLPAASFPPAFNLDEMMEATEDMAAPPIDDDDVGDFREILDSEIAQDIQKDEEKVSKMREDFLAELNQNESLSFDERQTLIDEFNDDMAQLEATLALERHKQEENLRNRLAIRQLKRGKQAEALLEDQALEAAMREKQELELNELERTFAEEQAKIENEFNSKMDQAKRKSTLLLERGNTRKKLDEASTDDIANAVTKEFDTKWKEQQRLLEDEAARAKAKLNARKKSRAKVQADQSKVADGTAALMETLNDIEAHQINRRFEADKDRMECIKSVQAQELRGVPMEAAAVAKLLAESNSKWITRAQDVTADELQWSHQWSLLQEAAITPELAQLNTKLMQGFAAEREAFERQQLEEKGKFGSLSHDDEIALDQLHDEFKAKWMSRSKELDDEEQRLKMKLKDRRDKRRQRTGDNTSQSELEVDVALERQELLALGQIIKSKELETLEEGNDHLGDKIAEIQRHFEQDWAKQQALLDAEAGIRRAQLQGRLKQHRERSPPGDITAVDINDEQEQKKLDIELQIEQEALNNSILADKKHLEAMTEDDENQIAEILREHEQKWATRQKLLDDDAALAHSNLAKRLQGKHKQIEEAALKLESTVRKNYLNVAALVERAQLGGATAADAQIIAEIVQGSTAQWLVQKGVLDDMEAAMQKELITTNATEEEQADVEDRFKELRNVLAIHEIHERAQVEALQQLKLNNFADDLINKLHEDHEKSSNDAKIAQEDEALRLRQRLKDRLARRKLTNEEVVIEEHQLKRELEAKKAHEIVKTLVENAQDLTSDDEETIRKLREQHERDARNRKNELLDEENRLKSSLQDRLKAKRENILKQKFDNPSAKAQALAQLGEMEKIETQQVQHEIDMKLDQEELQTLELESQLSLLPPTTSQIPDDSSIDKIHADFQAKWREKMKELEDEAQRRRARLAERLGKKRKQNESLPLLEKQAAEIDLQEEQASGEKEIESYLEKAREKLKLDELVEKSQLGLMNPDDEELIRKIQQDFKSKWDSRRQELNDEELRLKAAMKARLGSKRDANQRSSKSKEEKELVELQLETQEQLDTQRIDEKVDLKRKLLAQEASLEMQQLTRLNATPCYDDILDKVHAEHNKRERERAKWLIDEEIRLRQKLADRLAKRTRRGEIVSPEEVGELEAAVEVSVQEMKRQTVLDDLQDRIARNEATPEDDETIRRIKAEHDQYWSRKQKELEEEAERKRKRLEDRLAKRRITSNSAGLTSMENEKSLLADEAAAMHELKEELEMAQDKQNIARLVERKQLGLLSSDDEAMIQKIQDEHQKTWNSRKAVLEDEATQRKNALRDRLAAKRAAAGGTSALSAVETEEVVLTMELDQDLDDRRKEISNQGQKEATQLDRLEAPPSYDDEIERLHAEHIQQSKARARWLDDEENRLRQRLKDRLESRKRRGQPPTPEEIKELVDAVDAEIDAKRESVLMENMIEKSRLGISTRDDEEFIRKVREEHDSKWKEKQEALKNEEKRLKNQLADRLAQRRAQNAASAATSSEKKFIEEEIEMDEQNKTAELEMELNNAKQQMLVNQVAEKALLQLLSPDDKQLIDNIQDEYDKARRARQGALDDEEARRKVLLKERLKSKREAIQRAGASAAEKKDMESELAAEETIAQRLIHEDVEQKRQELDERASEHKRQVEKIQATYNDEIERIQAEYAQRCRERQNQLDDETTRMRNRLQERLAMRKKKTQDVKLTEEEELGMKAAVEAEIEAKRSRVELENLLDKAKIRLTSHNDEDLIRKIQDEHKEHNQLKKQLLDDEEATLKQKLADRLAKKRLMLKNSCSPVSAEHFQAHIGLQEEAELRAIEQAIDNKRKLLQETDQLVNSWSPKPLLTDSEGEINQINADHTKHTQERQRLLDQEEKLKKARLKERLEKKRQIRDEAKTMIDRPTTAEHKVEMIQELAKIDVEMSEKRNQLDAEAAKEQADLAEAVLQAKSDVDALIDRVKREHDTNIENLKTSLEADRAKQELALKDRIAARRKQKDQNKLDEASLAAQELAERQALEVKLSEEAVIALEKERQRAEAELAAIQRDATHKAELQALHAAKEKQMAEDEWNRLKGIHEVELKQLQSTLETEQQRQEVKLKDRIKQRREQKERELAACKDQDEILRARAALEAQEIAEKEKLAAQLTKKAEDAMQEELQRQEEARKAAEAKINQAVVEAAAATAAMDAFRASELERVSHEFANKMSELQRDTANEAKSQKSKLEVRMAAKKQKKAMELEAKKEEERKALLEKQRIEAEELQTRLAAAATMAQVDQTISESEKQTPRVDNTSEGNALAIAQEAEQKELEAKQTKELNQLERDAALEKMDTSRRLDNEIAMKMSASQEALHVNRELDRVTNEFQAKLIEHTDSLELESSQKKRDLMRRLEEKKKKKKDELMVKQREEREAAVSAQKTEQEKLATKLETEREVAMIQKLVTQNNIFVSQLTSIIERVVEKRHKREQSLLFAKQYRERAAVLRDSLQLLMQQKAKEKAALLESITDTTTRDTQMDELEAMYRVKQQDIEATGTHDVEEAQSQEQATLKERHVAEIAYLYQQFVPQCKPDIVAPPTSTAAPASASAHNTFPIDDENAAIRAHLELEKQARIDALLKDSAATMDALRQGLSEEWKILEDASTVQMANEKAESERIYQSQRQRILDQKEPPITEKKRAALVKALEAEKQKQLVALTSMLKARLQGKKERRERVCKRKLRRCDEDTKRRIDIVNAQFAVSLADELESRKTKDKLVKAPSIALLGLGKERLQGAVNRTRTLVSLGTVQQLVEDPSELNDHENEELKPAVKDTSKRNVDEPVSATPLSLISQKLDSIEVLIQRISKSTNGPAHSQVGEPVSISSALLSAYPDLIQDENAPTGPLQLVDDEKLAPRQRVRLDYGRQILNILDDSLTIQAVSVLPPGYNNGVFGHSMGYDRSKKTLYLRQSRLESVPELALLLVHTVSHIKVHRGEKFDNDMDQNFITEFYRMLGKCYQEFFAKKLDEGALTPSDSLGSLLPPTVGGPVSYFLPKQIESRLADMQAFLDQMNSNDEERDDQVTLLENYSPRSVTRKDRGSATTTQGSFKKMGSSRALLIANAEQQVSSLQECLDIAEKSYMETLKRFTEISDTVELLEDALSEAQAENNDHEIIVLSKKLQEAKDEVDRVKSDRDEVAKRCEKLRQEIKSKVEAN